MIQPATETAPGAQAAEDRCPRCHGPAKQFPEDIGACSRITEDRNIKICGPCGRDEAVRDMAQLPPIPPGEWPVTIPTVA